MFWYNYVIIQRDGMTKEELNSRLKKIGITKTELAKELDMTVGSINNWGGKQDVPKWVEILLDKYHKATAYDTIVKTVKEVEEASGSKTLK